MASCFGLCFDSGLKINDKMSITLDNDENEDKNRLDYVVG